MVLPIAKIPSVLSPLLLCRLTSGASFPLLRTLRPLISSSGPFPDQLVVLKLWDETGGSYPIPGEIPPLCGSLLPDLHS